jgi:hypothetical protein
MNQLVPISSLSSLPTLVAAAGERASMRFLEFFAANIRNPHTRRAYGRAADEFLAWCASAGVPAIGAVQPVHVATWIEAGTVSVQLEPTSSGASGNGKDAPEANVGPDRCRSASSTLYHLIRAVPCSLLDSAAPQRLLGGSRISKGI